MPDVAQVVGAGYMLGRDAGDSATIVKLLRVSLLTAVVVTVSVAFKGERERAMPDHGASGKPGRQALVPWFLWMFIGMVVLNSLGTLSLPVQSAANEISRACLVVAIAALGMKTSFNELAQLGWRPLALIAIETVWIATFVLAAVVWVR